MVGLDKAEAALKKAEDLLSNSQTEQAFNALYTLVTDKRNRVWNKSLEEAAKKFAELCADMRKGKEAREGLMQFRNVCQQSNVSSLESLIRFYLGRAEERAKEAQAKSDQIVLDVADLEELPENAILTAVSGEGLKDRTDREIVTPWLKFLWETYRTVLELLKSNPKLDAVYQDVAQKAFSFCQRFTRKNEFKNLCEILRNHLSNMVKQTDQRTPDSFHSHLETRLKQLQVACALELWQVVFNTVEDIHGLVSLIKRPPKGTLMADYFEILTKIFWQSKNALFHAFAYSRLYNLSKGSKKEIEDSQLLCSLVLLSALAVPPQPPKSSYDIDDESDKRTRITQLLGAAVPPKRKALLSEAISKRMPDLAYPQLKNVYNTLEVDFQPLTLCARMQPVFEFLQSHPQLSIYVPHLQHNTVLRLLEQLSQVYQVMKIEKLAKLISFVTFNEAEKMIVDIAKEYRLNLSIDYQTSTVKFNAVNFESDQMKSQISELYINLATACEMIHPELIAEKESKKKKMFDKIASGAKEENLKLLARRTEIENRRVEEERKKAEESRVLKEKEKKELEQKKEKEAAKIAKEKKKREEEALKKLKQEQEQQQKQQIIEENEALKALLTQKKKGSSKLQQDISKLDKEDLIEIRNKEAEKEKMQKETKIKSLVKKLDWIEEERFKVEKPLLQAYLEKLKHHDHAALEEYTKKQAEEKKKRDEERKVEKDRLGRMKNDRVYFMNMIMEQRTAVYNAEKAEQDERRAEQKRKWDAEMAEKKRVEKEKREAEEKIKREEEERIRKKKDEEEKKKKDLDRVAEMQRKREAEIEAKRKAQEEEDKKKTTTKYVPPRVRGTTAPSEVRTQESPKREEPKKDETAPKKYVPPSIRSKMEGGNK